MPNTYANVQRPATLLHYARLRNLDPRWVALNIPLLWHSFYYRIEHCDIALNTNIWTTAVTGGGAPTAFAYQAVRGGVFRGATGTTDDGYTTLRFANVAFDAADNPGMYVRFLAPAAVTGFGLEIGFSDPKTSEVLKGVTGLSAAAVPTVANGVTDIAAVCLDTDYTLTTAALVGDGTTGSASGALIGTWTPTASCFIDIIVQVQANLASCQIWDDGAYIGDFGVTNGPDVAVLMNPYIQFATRNTTSKQIDIKKIVLWGEENRTT